MDEVARWRSKLEKVTAVYSSEPKGGGSIYGKTADIMAKIVDLEADINQDIDQLVNIRDGIKTVIEAVKDDRERVLLQYRYLDGRTFEWIACEMNYNYRWIKRLHSRAVNKIKIGPQKPPLTCDII